MAKGTNPGTKTIPAAKGVPTARSNTQYSGSTIQKIAGTNKAMQPNKMPK